MKGKILNRYQRMHNFRTKFVKILEICKQFSQDLVNDKGNIIRRGPVPKFSDLEVVALSLVAEAESIDSEKWLSRISYKSFGRSIHVSSRADNLMTAGEVPQVCARR